MLVLRALSMSGKFWPMAVAVGEIVYGSGKVGSFIASELVTLVGSKTS